MGTWRYSCTFTPHRGDVVEAWLRRIRDDYDRYSREWRALDDAMENYRLRADLGLSLESGERVSLCSR